MSDISINQRNEIKAMINESNMGRSIALWLIVIVVVITLIGVNFGSRIERIEHSLKLPPCRTSWYGECH